MPPAPALAADQSETPVLLAFFLACWRWLMPLACAIVAPARSMPPALPAADTPAPPRRGLRLALIHAPPLRLLS